MPEPELLKHDMTGDLPPRPHADDQVLRHVLACVDASSFADAVLAHAAAVAMAMRARVTAMRVLESSAVQSPMDPVEWTLRHRDVEADLRERASHFGGLQTDTVIDDGPAAERICAWARDNAVELTVLGRCGESNGSFAGLGGTARRVAEVVNASVLIVPSSQVGDAPIRYRRVLIPLDGSSRSECALPLGLGIAAAHDAEIGARPCGPECRSHRGGPARSGDHHFARPAAPPQRAGRRAVFDTSPIPVVPHPGDESTGIAERRPPPCTRARGGRRACRPHGTFLHRSERTSGHVGGQRCRLSDQPHGHPCPARAGT